MKTAVETSPPLPKQNEDLLASFCEEVKVEPDPKAIRKVNAIALNAIAANRKAVRIAPGHDGLTKKLEDIGAILSPQQLAIMGVGADQIVTLPLGDEVDMRRKGFFYLQALTHPALLETLLIQQQTPGRLSPAQEIPLFEELISGSRAHTYEDFGLQPREPDPTNDFDESCSRILARGLFMPLSRNHVGFPILSNSMPSTNSADALAALALIGTFACIPTDGHLAPLSSRISLVRSARWAIDNHPVVKDHKYADHKLSNDRTLQAELKDRKKMLVATLKQNPKTVTTEAEALYAEGIRVFRVYDAGSTNQLVDAVRVLKEKLPANATILAGQVTGVDQARRLVDAGADGLIVGIGEGGICTTPVVGSLAPNNIFVAYRICKAGLGVPVICDGGVGRAAGVTFAMGASANMASRRNIGGTLEQSPTGYWLYRDGEFCKPYAGEASRLIKQLGRNVTMVGDAYNVEGVEGYVTLDRDYPTIAAKYYALLCGLAKTVRFMRCNSLADLVNLPPDTIKLLSDGARHAAQAHHRSS